MFPWYIICYFILKHIRVRFITSFHKYEENLGSVLYIDLWSVIVTELRAIPAVTWGLVIHTAENSWSGYIYIELCKNSSDAPGLPKAQYNGQSPTFSVTRQLSTLGNHWRCRHLKSLHSRWADARWGGEHARKRTVCHQEVVRGPSIRSVGTHRLWAHPVCVTTETGTFQVSDCMQGTGSYIGSVLTEWVCRFVDCRESYLILN